MLGCASLGDGQWYITRRSSAGVNQTFMFLVELDLWAKVIFMASSSLQCRDMSFLRHGI